MRPILKWPGGKTQLLPAIREVLPERFGTYFDAFFGGGALFFDLADTARLSRAVLSDKNQPLMRAYEEIERDPARVFGQLAALIALGLGRDRFYAEQRKYNEGHQDAARLIFLNRQCFNGHYRETSQGEISLTYGKPASRAKTWPVFPGLEALQQTARALRRAEIRVGDFERALDEARSGDLAFLDPPYEGSTFNYTGSGWSASDQVRLARIARDLVRRGVHVIACDHDTPRVRVLWQNDFDLLPVGERRSINSKTDARGEVSCVLIRSKT